MSTVDRLIADRGHGLSPAQKRILQAVGRGEVYRDELAVRRASYARGERRACTATVVSLWKLGLVQRGERSGRYSRWGLTPDGETLLARMGGDR